MTSAAHHGSTDSRSLLRRHVSTLSPGFPLTATTASVKQRGRWSDTETRTRVWLNISEYLAAYLTKERWSEYSLASRTMALDLSARRWSDDVCQMFGLTVDVFPTLRAATEGVPIASYVAARLGLSPNVRVHVAGHDHMVGAYGANLSSSQLLNSTGTTEGLLLLRDHPDLGEQAAQRKVSGGISCDGQHATSSASIPTAGAMFAFLKSFLGWDQWTAYQEPWPISRRSTKPDGSISHGSPSWCLTCVEVPPPAKISSARGVISGPLRGHHCRGGLVFGCLRLSPRRLTYAGYSICSTSIRVSSE